MLEARAASRLRHQAAPLLPCQHLVVHCCMWAELSGGQQAVAWYYEVLFLLLLLLLLLRVLVQRNPAAGAPGRGEVLPHHQACAGRWKQQGGLRVRQGQCWWCLAGQQGGSGRRVLRIQGRGCCCHLLKLLLLPLLHPWLSCPFQKACCPWHLCLHWPPPGGQRAFASCASPVLAPMLTLAGTVQRPRKQLLPKGPPQTPRHAAYAAVAAASPRSPMHVGLNLAGQGRHQHLQGCARCPCLTPAAPSGHLASWPGCPAACPGASSALQPQPPGWATVRHPHAPGRAQPQHGPQGGCPLGARP
mmetsp:Transcript_3959/g.9221  ORF Transcript_3959/g.9221 Transcript_3959/m.9221 type:complete len:302 (-) Transcript_3959:21-926(-)